MINQVIFNSVNFWEELGCAPSAPVNYPIPAEIKELVKVKGANGSLTEATGYYNNLEIEVNFRGLITHAKPQYKDFHSIKRKINQIFNGINDNRLFFSSVPDRCYKVKSCGVGAVSQVSDYEINFNVTFVCDPFLYNPLERPATSTGSIEYNGDIPNAPVIKVNFNGHGQVTVFCNGEDLIFEAQRGLHEINLNPFSIVTRGGVPVKSRGKQPVLKKGLNEIRINGVVFSSVEIIKNERYLG